ncbi:MAG: hypothetical protein V1839_03715 [archaeon]
MMDESRKIEPGELKASRYQLVGLLVDDLEAIKLEQIPPGFLAHKELLEDTMPYFSEREKKILAPILPIAETQITYLQNNGNEQADDKFLLRMIAIDDFLNNQVYEFIK